MTQEQILKAVFTKQSDAIQQVIKRTCIVDYGVVTKVLGNNVIQVGISVANNVEDVQLITCTLVTLCSSALSVDIEVVEGDKVLVVFPRHYNPKMFDTEVKDPIIDDTVQGYSRYAGLAFLVNQFDYDSHRNNIQLTADGVMTTRIPYDEDDTANVFTAKTDEEGLMSFDIAKDSDEDDADLVTFTVDQDGNIGVQLHQGDTSFINVLSEGKLEYGVGEDKNKITFDLSDTENQTTVITTYDTTVTTDKDNNLTIDNTKTTFNADKDGAFSITNTKATASSDKDGKITIDNGKATVTIDTSGNVEINAQGKYSIKNNSTDLKAVIDGLAQELENLITVGSPATQATSPASKATIATWRTSKLSLLFK